MEDADEEVRKPIIKHNNISLTFNTCIVWTTENNILHIKYSCYYRFERKLTRKCSINQNK